MTVRADLEGEVSKFFSKPAWGLRRTHGSMFFLEIGNEKARSYRKSDGSVNQYVHGDWTILIECTFWRFEKLDRAFVGSEDDQAEIDRQFQLLDPGLIERLEVVSPSLDLLIAFNSGVRFRRFSSMVYKDYNEWTLYCPDEYCWNVKSGGRLIRRHKDEVPQQGKA